jgi:holliday junction DNA helicase RuvA
MIAHLDGTVSSIKSTWLTLSVGGVGYKVYGSPNLLTFVLPGQTLAVWTHLVVREDALDLYGFVEYGELELFQLLISVSGVGPRSAIGILALDKLDKLKGAIAASDIGYLTGVSGIGKKSAEKICLELRDKLGDIEIADTTGTRREDEDALEALKALGYRADEARDALRLVSSDITEQNSRIREALKLLARQ